MVSKAPTPSFDGLLSIFCKHLGFQLEMGSFVVYGEDRRKAGRSKWSVGRLLDTRAMYRDPKDVDVKLQVFKSLKESELCGTRSQIVGNTAFIPEVVETNITIWVPTSSILSPCFVFLQKELYDFFNCQGMTNIYQLRYAEDGTQVSQLKHFASDYAAFPGLSCAGSRLWIDMRRAQNTLATILSTERQGQGTYCSQSRKTLMSPEGWAYIKNVRALSGHLNLSKIVKLDISLSRVATGPGITRKATLVKAKAEKVRFQSGSDLAVVVSLLGEASLFGTRDPRPKVDKPAFLRPHAAINHVKGVAEACNKPRKRTTNSGVDFTYCAAVQELSIACRYHKYTNTPGVENPFKRMRVLINFGDPTEVDQDNEEEEEDDGNTSVEGDPAVECGAQFMYGSEVATITAVLLNGKVEAELSNGVVVVLDHDETIVLVDAYTNF